jgi:hypothetical protein
MVVGTYIANYDKIKSTLVLKEDGTYDYNLETEDGEKYFNSNSWEFYEINGRQEIVLNKLKFYYDPFPFSKEKVNEKPVFWGLPAVRDFRGRIKLIINGDMGLYYFKQ